MRQIPTDGDVVSDMMPTMPRHPMESSPADFDSSHPENFCAAVLLLTMDADPAVRDLVANLVRAELELDASNPLVGFGLEARFVKSRWGDHTRVDLWLRFDSPSGPLYAFIEVETSARGDATQAKQAREQAERSPAGRIHGTLLLAPDHLCKEARDGDERVRFVAWPRLFADVRALRSPSALREHAIRVLEEELDRPVGMDRAVTLSHFEQAMAIMASLRQFLLDCIADVGGLVQDKLVEDRQPSGRRAWQGLAVPFARDGQEGAVGIYKDELQALRLEVHLGGGDAPVASVEFTPPTLSSNNLGATREAFKAAWTQRVR